MNTSARLRKFMRERKFVRFSRKFEQGYVRGYVLDVGPKFCMVATLGHGIRFDGFGCFRITDLRDLKADPHAAFHAAALRKMGARAPKKPSVSVASTPELLLSANKCFPLVTIHRETVRPGSCWIGKIEHVDETSVSILEIAPGAKWDKKPTSYKLREITSIEFGGEYEEGLHLIGGNPPSR
jgi:hypothetical protein